MKKEKNVLFIDWKFLMSLKNWCVLDILENKNKKRDCILLNQCIKIKVEIKFLRWLIKFLILILRWSCYIY